MNRILADSPVPSHVDSSGSQANREICFRVWKVGPTSRSAQRDTPSSRPNRMPAPLPVAKPERSRTRLARRPVSSWPLPTTSQAAATTAVGGTISFVFTSCSAVTRYHSTRKASGKTKPRRSVSRMFVRMRIVVSSVSLPLPALQACFAPGQQPVQHDAHRTDDEHADDDDIELQQLPAPHHQVADAFARRQQLPDGV